MDTEESSWILKAVTEAWNVDPKKAKPKPKQHKAYRDLFQREPDFLSCVGDATGEAIKRLKRTRLDPTKDIDKWSSKDFLKFLRQELPGASIGLGTYECTLIQKLQDQLTHLLERSSPGAACTNETLRDFFAWWKEQHFGKLTSSGTDVTIYSVCHHGNLPDFVASLAKGHRKPTKAHQRKKSSTTGSWTPGELYELGGSENLICEVGVVDAYWYLASRKGATPEGAMDELCRCLSEMHPAIVERSILRTKKRSPYKASAKIDTARMVSVLQSRGIVSYSLSTQSLFPVAIGEDD